MSDYKWFTILCGVFIVTFITVMSWRDVEIKRIETQQKCTEKKP